MALGVEKELLLLLYLRLPPLPLAGGLELEVERLLAALDEPTGEVARVLGLNREQLRLLGGQDSKAIHMVLTTLGRVRLGYGGIAGAA